MFGSESGVLGHVGGDQTRVWNIKWCYCPAEDVADDLFVPETDCVKAACSLSGSSSPSWWAAARQSRRVALSGGGQLLIQLSPTLRSSERISDLRNPGCMKMNGAMQECDCVTLCRYYLTLGGGGGTRVLPCSETCAHTPTFLRGQEAHRASF